MNEWLERGIYQVNALLQRDADFLELLQQLTEMRKDYLSVIKKLSSKEQEIIKNHIAQCEEAEYQRAITAYCCGKITR